MNIQKFSSKAIKELGYYVYLYSDPDTHVPFYVGKGKGNRVFAHLNDTSESEKVKKITSIRKDGKEPLIEILVHGLSDELTAFKVESAVIDLIGKKNLTNMQRGFESRTFGRITAVALDDKYRKDELTTEDITENVIMIRINKLYNSGLTPYELYDITRACWAVNKERADKAKYAISIFQGVVIEMYEITSPWLEAGSTFYTSWWRTEDDTPEDRYEFVGRVVKDEILRKKYVGKTVSKLFPKGNQNPIRYFYLDEK